MALDPSRIAVTPDAVAASARADLFRRMAVAERTAGASAASALRALMQGGLSGLRLSGGSFGASHPGGGAAQFNVTVPWTTSHAVFLAEAWPGATWAGFSTLGAIVWTTVLGLVEVSSTGGQSITINYLSIGK